MTDPTQWNAGEKEKRLRRLFEKAQHIEESEFLTVEFGDDALYQYMPGVHNVSGTDHEILDRMAAVIEQYDLLVERSSSDRDVLQSIVSIARRIVGRNPSSSAEWITVAHRHPESADDAYAIFTDIRETVFNYDPDDVTEATISRTERDGDISWTDV